MALIVVIQNDMTGDAEVGNYNWAVYINNHDHQVAKGRIEGHDRRQGWERLVVKLAEILSAKPAPPRPPDTRYGKLAAEKLFEAIKHGDADHQKWLRDKLYEYFEVPV